MWLPGKPWPRLRIWQSPLDSVGTKSCCEGEAGQTLYFRACGDCRRLSSGCRLRIRSEALSNREEAAGILCDAVEAHFEMQVRPGGAAGVTNESYRLSLGHEHAFGNESEGHV